MMTLNVGRAKVGVGVMDGVSVGMGVKVLVGVKMGVGVEVRVAVSVEVGIGVEVQGAAVAVWSAAVFTTWTSGGEPQAENTMTARRRKESFFMIPGIKSSRSFKRPEV
jgi:hypothetical protein